MSVNWYWKDKMGTVEYKDEDGVYTVSVYRGNCLCVLIYEFKEKEVEKYIFHGFFNDLIHLKTCVGLTKDYEGKYTNIYKGVWGKWKLNTFFKDSLQIANVLTKAGFPVELYYEEIKGNESI